MIVYTDNIDFAERILPKKPGQWALITASANSESKPLVERLYDRHTIYKSVMKTPFLWQQMYIVDSASCSQYDILIELCRKNITLPHGAICLAGEGTNFHGFKDRPWSAPSGNIYLSVYLAPCQIVDHYGVGFTILAAVSVIEAIDSIPGLKDRANIKWVNDVLIDGAKISGVLAYTQAEDKTVTGAVLGIGLNVETTPQLEPTPFVPEAASLRGFASEPKQCNQRLVLERLIQALDKNYRILISGGYKELLDRYSRRSLVIGRRVDIYDDKPGAVLEVIASGQVSKLGENIELFLEGINRPFSKGRLILKN